MAGEKEVYRYELHGQECFADPLACYRRVLEACQGDLGSELEAVRRPPPGTVEQAPELMNRLGAEERLAEASRKGFGLPAFDPATGEGATDAQALRVLYDFLGWLEKNDEPRGSPRTSPQPTAQAS
jgi:hypothetical protein